MITKEQLLSHFAVLYADDDAKDSSATGGRLASSECAEQGLCSRAVTCYGEVSPAHMDDLLRVAELAASAEHEGFHTFWDIGSGTGKACFLAAMSGRFEVCVGLEVLTSLHARATTVLAERWPQVRDAIKDKAESVLAGTGTDTSALQASFPASVIFYQADLRDACQWGREWLTSTSWLNSPCADKRLDREPAAPAAPPPPPSPPREGPVLVFANCTMFEPALMEALAAAVRDAPRGSVFLSFTKPLPGSCDCSTESSSAGSARHVSREDCVCGAKEYEREHEPEQKSRAGVSPEHTHEEHLHLGLEPSTTRLVWRIVDELESEASWGCVSVFVHARVEW